LIICCLFVSIIRDYLSLFVGYLLLICCLLVDYWLIISIVDCLSLFVIF